MIDFKVSDEGDLVIGHKKELPQLRFSFHVTDQPVFHLTFDQKMEYAREEHEGFHLQFATYNHNIQSPAIVRSVINDEWVQQYIRNLLRTEYGELRNRDTFGSHLYQQKHKNLIQADTISAIQDTVKNELEKTFDLYESDIRVVASSEKVEGPFYCQNMMIYIFEDEDLIYQFPLI